MKSGKQVSTFRGHVGKVNALVVAPSGKILASGGDDNAIKLWELESGRQITTLKGHEQGIKVVAFSQDGKTLMSGSKKMMKIWEINR